MSRRNRIVLFPDRGVPFEGIIKTGETFYPGMIVQIDPTVALVDNKHTCKIFDRAADGDRPAGPFIVVCEDLKIGQTITDAYPVGSSALQRFVGFIPWPGAELNLLYKNVSGTADDVIAGDLLIVDDGTGKMIVTTGSPQCEPAMALEALTDPTADALLWCAWSGR